MVVPITPTSDDIHFTAPENSSNSMNETDNQIAAEKSRAGLFEFSTSNPMPYSSDQPPPYSSLSIMKEQKLSEASMASDWEGPFSANPILTTAVVHSPERHH